jgi:site-specific DNA-cytosine methylase
MLQTSWFVKVIRSGARYEDGTLPPEVWREKVICPTLNAFDNSGESRAVVTIVHSTQDALSRQEVRRLTPVECEKLQGFPSGWTDGQSDSARYKQMGNAVTANVVEWIGGRL